MKEYELKMLSAGLTVDQSVWRPATVNQLEDLQQGQDEVLDQLTTQTIDLVPGQAMFKGK